jgi:Tfp pilus assembly protein PilF
MIYYILAIIISVCCGVIVKIALGKARKLKVVDSEPTAEEKQAEVKQKLIELRLKKNFLKVGGFFVFLINKIKALIFRWKYLVKNVRLKKDFKLKFQPREKKQERPLETSKPGDNTELKNKLMEAEVFLKKRKLEEAEQKFIEALESDPKNAAAYMGLAEIYSAKKDWQAAEETYWHVTKIQPDNHEAYGQLSHIFRNGKKWEALKGLSEKLAALGWQEAWIYVNLGLAYRKTGYPEKAEEYLKKAVEIEPKNEKMLDYLIEVAIINKNKTLAEKAFNSLMSLSADQIKLQDYRDKIDII